MLSFYKFTLPKYNKTSTRIVRLEVSALGKVGFELCLKLCYLICLPQFYMILADLCG
jgi:hypothetical protein